jgi:citrate lyase subunit beta/citryl-CoA lyase
MLFAPGNQARKVQKALTELPTDAVILDLEDAVPIASKEQTRDALAAALSLPRRAGVRVYVRVNGVDTPWFFGDLDAVVVPGLDGIVLPKTAGAQAVFLADRYLTHRERERGITAGSIELMPLVESAEGLANLAEICSQGLRGGTRVRSLGFGAADFTTDVGAIWTPGEDELLLARTQLVHASRLAGLDPPVDTVYPHFHDLEGLERTSRRARDLGFQGRTCIHPDQLEPVNRIFSPTPEEISWAEEVMAAFSEAEARGVAAIQVRGQLIDYAFLPRARRILAQAGRVPEAPGG